MSFLRHKRSIVRWILPRRPEAKWLSASPLPLIGMMSRSRLFLGGLRSRRARLRFNGRLHLAPAGRIRKPGLRKVAHFSIGIMPHFQPELTRHRWNVAYGRQAGDLEIWRSGVPRRIPRPFAVCDSLLSFSNLLPASIIPGSHVVARSRLRYGSLEPGNQDGIELGSVGLAVDCPECAGQSFFDRCFLFSCKASPRTASHHPDIVPSSLPDHGVEDR